MSSMRNAVQRRNHKERAQPKERERWGLLEKHKDYSLRAKDYNVKKARIRTLRTKVAERNPDEFRHGMLSSTTAKGRKITQRGNNSLSNEAVKLLKTQDSAYLRLMLQRTSKQIEQLKEEFVLRSYVQDVAMKGPRAGLNEASDHGKIFFSADADSQSQMQVSFEEILHHIQETSSSIESAESQQISYDRMTREQKAKKDDLLRRKRTKKATDIQKTKLKSLFDRKVDLLAAERELETQRAKMNNATGGTTRAGVKFRIRERKR